VSVHAHPATDNHRSRALYVALAWAARGIPVFAICIGWDDTKYRTGGTTKRPLTPNGHHDATTDPDTIEAMFAQASAPPGTVIACGILVGPAGYLCIDIDNKTPGVNGYVCAELLDLPDTYTIRTPSGGEHRYYTKIDDRPIGNASPWADRGIDIRADDGWTVAPGTHTPWGNWVRADDAQAWPDDVTPIPDRINRQLTTSHPTTSAGPKLKNRLTAELRQTLHPTTRTALELLEQHHGAHDPDWYIENGRSYVLVSRPGKTDGPSASVGRNGDGTIWNWSSTWRTTHGLPLETNCWLLPDGTPTTNQLDLWPTDPQPAPTDLEVEIAGVAPNPDHAPFADYRLDWNQFWTAPQGDDWLIEPIIAAHRAHALYAPAKTGKSLLITWLAAMAALGRPTLERPAGDPLTVLYCDLEMTPDDLRDRLENMGLGPDDNLTHLHWLSLPPLVLDTPDGARALVEHAVTIAAELVVIDTTARAVTGDENSADTYRAFARWTGVGLKRHGIAYVRTDHAGKDLDRGQRGSSAKNDDVDIVWQLAPRDQGSITLKATHRRMGWVDDQIVLARHDDPLRYEITKDSTSWPAGTADMARRYDEHNIPLELSGRQAVKAARAAGIVGKTQLLSKAQEYRRSDLRGWPE
jgi:hypothetical protein